MNKKIQTFIGSIRDEVLGFSFGKPWRHGEEAITCVLPIIRESKKKRKYITLAEAKNVAIFDTGTIDSLRAVNNEKVPVFFRMGELLKGKTQGRTLTLSRILMPGEEMVLDVKCIHASHPISSSATFNHGCFAPGKDADYAQALHSGGRVSQARSWDKDRKYSEGVRSSLMNLGTSGKIDQGGVSYNASLNVSMACPDDLEKVRDTYNEAVESILKDVPLVADQIGMALVDLNGFYSLDCFDLHDSWKAVKEALVGKESLSIAKQTKDAEVFEYKPYNAKKFVRRVLGSGYEEKIQHDSEATKTFTLDFSDYIGEAVVLGNEVVHLLVIRKDKRENVIIP